MSYDKSVSNHYLHGNLTNAIKQALPSLGKTTQTVTIEDLAPVDEFHIGGRVATDNLINQLNLPKHGNIIDVGCGLGGAARYVSTRYKNHVTGIDLTSEYIETGKILSSWLGLNNEVNLIEGSALSMPFDDNIFDGGYMLHVGMNIEDKESLFSEIHRVLKAGSSFGIYDIMQENDGQLSYPVPWATDTLTCKLATLEEYKQALLNAGFTLGEDNHRGNFALDFFKQLKAKTEANGGPPPLGLHTLMQGTTADKIKNMISNITNGYIAPIEIIVRKN